MSEGYIVSVWPDLFQWVPTIAEGVDLALDHIKKEDNDRTWVGYYVRNFEIKRAVRVSLRAKAAIAAEALVEELDCAGYYPTETVPEDKQREIARAFEAVVNRIMGPQYDEVGEETVTLRVERLSHKVYDVVDVELPFWISSKTSSRDLLEEVNNALGAV